MKEEDIVTGWSERIRSAPPRDTPCAFAAGGTKDWYGQALTGEILDTRPWRGIIAYDPAELVITARAGTPLRESKPRSPNITRCFRSSRPTSDRTPPSAAASRQASPARAGPPPARRAISYSARVIMDGHGQVLLHFGGQVVKNARRLRRVPA